MTWHLDDREDESSAGTGQRRQGVGGTEREVRRGIGLNGGGSIKYSPAPAHSGTLCPGDSPREWLSPHGCRFMGQEAVSRA